MQESKEIHLFSYLDYRAFLRDWLTTAKQGYGFSYRAFSRRAGFRSPSIFKMVMDGDRDLVEGSLRKFLEGLGLSAAEREYFAALVSYNQARTQEDKVRYLARLRMLREEGGESKNDEGFRISLHLSSENEALIKAKIEEFSNEMTRLFGRRLDLDAEWNVTISVVKK